MLLAGSGERRLGCSVTLAPSLRSMRSSHVERIEVLLLPRLYLTVGILVP